MGKLKRKTDINIVKLLKTLEDYLEEQEQQRDDEYLSKLENAIRLLREHIVTGQFPSGESVRETRAVLREAVKDPRFVELYFADSTLWKRIRVFVSF